MKVRDLLYVFKSIYSLDFQIVVYKYTIYDLLILVKINIKFSIYSETLS